MKLALALATILLVGIPLVGIPLGGQDAVKHAPSVDQCRADQLLVDAKIHHADDATVETITNWIHEMRECTSVDNEHLASYACTMGFAMGLVGTRATNFLTRHNLMTQFVQEDMAGKR
jgi:hypothetical protein